MTLSTSVHQRLLSEAPALCEVIRDIHRRGWCDGTGGNFSCLLCRDPDYLLMAPSGVDKGSLQPEDLIVVDGSGQVVRGEGKASAETLFHLTILAQTNAKAVLHTHSQAATLLSRFPMSLGPDADHCSRNMTENNQLPRSAVPGDSESRPAPCPRNLHHSPGLFSNNFEDSTESNQRLNIPLATERVQVTSTVPSHGSTISKDSTEHESSHPLPVLLGYVHIKSLEMLKGLEGIQSHHSAIAIPILENCQDMRLLSQAACPHITQAPYSVLIAGHGLYTWGNSLLQARRHLEITEFLLEQHWREMLLNLLMTKAAPSA